MGELLLAKKSYAFAVRIIRLMKYLAEKKEYILGKQILRSGTAIGALIREAEYAESDIDFIHKLHISLKEANETEYWLSLLKDTDYLSEKAYASIEKDCKEMIALLVSSIKTMKEKVKSREGVQGKK